MNKKILFWGAKSKGKILQNMLNKDGEEVSFIFDKYIEKCEFKTDAVFSNSFQELDKFIESSTHFVVCIGGEFGKARYLISNELIKRGLLPLSVISKNSIIDDTSTVGWGLQAMPLSMCHCFSSIGNAVIFNSNSTVDHDCIVGNGVHIMGGASIAGQVQIEDYATVGTNATIFPRITIGTGAYVGAGSVVNKNVLPNQVVAGNPAIYLRENRPAFDTSYFN